MVRTAEELGIDLNTRHELRYESMGMKIVDVAESVLERYRSGHRSPSYGPIHFTDADRSGHCQKNVRQLIEAAVYGESDSWPEADCCAGQTRRNLHRAARRGKYQEITDIERIIPGDLVYLSGGPGCSRCGGSAGHAMVCVGRDHDGNLMMWQNVSTGDRALCEIPLVDWQSRRFVAAYRFQNLKLHVAPPPPSILSNPFLVRLSLPPSPLMPDLIRTFMDEIMLLRLE